MRKIAGAPALVLFAALIDLVVLSTQAAPTAEFTPEMTCPSCEDYDACTVDSCDTATESVPRILPVVVMRSGPPDPCATTPDSGAPSQSPPM